VRPHSQTTFVSLIVALLIGTAIIAGASAASADGKPEFYRGFYVELGSFAPLDVNTRIGVSIPEIVLDQDLDLDRILESSDDASRSRFRGGVRFNRRHELEFSYLSVDRENDVLFQEDFLFLNQNFTIGIDVHTVLNTEDLELGYKYFMVVAPRGEFGFSIGIHAVRTEFSISAETSVTPAFPGLADLSVVETDSLDVPLPYLGLYFDIKLGEKFYLGVFGKILDLEIDDYSGSWHTLEVTLEHWTFKHVGFGVGYYLNDLDVQRENVDEFSINGLDMRQSGVQAYVRLSNT